MRALYNTRRSVTGPFAVQDLGNGAFRLIAGGAGPAEVYVRFAAPGAAAFFDEARLGTLEFDWREDGVHITGSGGAGSGVTAVTALVHEPRGRLYEALPLAGMDKAARRFWRRIFILMRLPGGRRVLKLIARRTRSR